MVVHAMQLIASDKKHIVVGLGKTGISCVRYLLSKGAQVEAVDTRENPPGLAEFKAEFPDVPVRTGPLDPDYLATADDLVMSPGVPPCTPEIQFAVSQGVELTGDIDLFSCVAEAPIVAITGSNGKTTVTTLLGEMARNAGTKVAVGGNIGTPVLDLIDPSIELYVLELSSFQLETTRRLGALTATVLNVTEDHMDRYPSLLTYHATKHKIFNGARNVVVNDDLPLTVPLMKQGMKSLHYGFGSPGLKKFSIVDDRDEQWLAFGYRPLLPVSQIRLKGKHNLYNVMAAFALGHSAGIPMDAMIETVRNFSGLPHRCEFVRELDHVTFINDSKGTNVGATVAAIESLAESSGGKIVLLAGGDAKGADLSPLAGPVRAHCRTAILYGRDAQKIASALDGLPLIHADGLEEAVRCAAREAMPGDIVLLSPACASFDMFPNYEVRGETFRTLVQKL